MYLKYGIETVAPLFDRHFGGTLGTGGLAVIMQLRVMDLDIGAVRTIICYTAQVGGGGGGVGGRGGGEGLGRR